MSLLVSQSSLCLRKPVFVRSSSLPSNEYSSSTMLQTPPCYTISIDIFGPLNTGRFCIRKANEDISTQLEKRVPMKLNGEGTTATIGASHGWVATLTKGRTLSLQDDLNPYTTDPKHIPLPPLVTLPHCQTQIVTNVSMSSSSPEDEDCVVAVKFLGPQLSFCRPARGEWTNVRIENPCFFSSRVMFSEKDDMFHIPGSGGHVIGSWDLRGSHKQLHNLRYHNLPNLTKKTRERFGSCCTTEHLVESRTTGETFIVKLYRKTVTKTILNVDFPKLVNSFPHMKTQDVMVFKLDGEGNAVYTEDIGDLVIFISKSEPFCVPASSFGGCMFPNTVRIFYDNESAEFSLGDYSIESHHSIYRLPYLIPPQNID